MNRFLLTESQQVMDYFEPGIILDDFELGPVRRDGAMARLYRATDRLTGETVALKVPFKDILNIGRL